MKWLSNLLKGNKSGEEPVRLKLEEVDSWLKEQEDISGFAGRLDAIYSRMEKATSSLDRDVSLLDSAQADQSTPSKLLRAGLAARGETVKQFNTLSEKLQPPRKRDIDSVFQHHWTALKALERTATTFGRAQRYVAALFPRKIEAISSDLAEISRIMLELEEEVGKKRKFSEEAWFIRELAERLEQNLPRLAELDEKAREDEVGLEDLRSRLSALEEDSRQQAQSVEGRRAEELKASLERAKRERARAEEELAGLIAPLGKALARMAKQGSSSRISLEHEGVFQRLLEAPERVGDEEISGSLEELQSHLSRLGLKDRKKEKTLEHIGLLIREKSLQKATAKKVALDREIEDTQEALFRCSREGHLLKEEAAQVKRSQKSLQSELEQAKRDLVIGRERAEADEKELRERLARIAGRPLELELPGKR